MPSGILVQNGRFRKSFVKWAQNGVAEWLTEWQKFGVRSAGFGVILGKARTAFCIAESRSKAFNSGLRTRNSGLLTPGNVSVPILKAEVAGEAAAGEAVE